ncbi:MAG: M28 family peptidase [Phycisphaerae bacterium]|nr:M28 family peptidase [Phycisphaerae bacterium]
MLKAAVMVLAATVACAGLSGCGTAEQTEEQKKAAKAAVEAARITPRQRAAARDWLNREAWTETIRQAVPEDAAPDHRRFQLHLRALMDGAAHRLAGYEDGSRRASRYVEKALTASGIDEVYIQEFPVVQPVTTQCELYIDGQKVAGMGDIHPVRPNVTQASVTPAEGLTGQAVYVAGGKLEDYPGLVKGKIVVMDYHAADRWLSAFGLGARAVIFIGPDDDTPAGRAWHHVNVPANLPRFYVPHAVAERIGLRDAQQVTIKAACEWRELLGRNVVGVLRGRTPEFGDERPQALLLSAPLDSYSEVPERSAGARPASNCAALLSIIETLSQDRPKRDVIVCFFDGVAQNLAGARAFYGAIYRQMKGVGEDTLEQRLEMYDRELGFWSALDAIAARMIERWDKHERLEELRAAGEEVPQSLTDEIARLYIFSEESKNLDRHHRVLLQLRDEAQNIDGEVLEQLRPLRVDLRELRQDRNKIEEQLADLQEQQADQADDAGEQADRLAQRIAEKNRELQRVDRTIADKAEQERDLSIEDLAWNSVERVLHEERDILDVAVRREMFEGHKEQRTRDALLERTPQRYHQLAVHTRRLCRERRDVLQRAQQRMRQGVALREAVGTSANTVLLHIGVNLGDDGTKWALVHGDDSLPLGRDTRGEYDVLFNVAEEIYEADPTAFDHLQYDAFKRRFPNRTFAPALFADASSAARIFGVLNVVAVTSMDRRAREGQPVDTLPTMDLGRLAPQVRELGRLTGELANTGRLAAMKSKVAPDPRYAEAEWDERDRVAGPSIKRAGAGSAMADLPVRDAVVTVVPWVEGQWNVGALGKVPPGYNHLLVTKTSINGTYTLPVHLQDYYEKCVVFAASYDRPPITAGSEARQQHQSRGIIRAATAMDSIPVLQGDLSKVVQFNCRGLSFVGYGFRRRNIATKAMRARSTAPFRADRHLVCELDDIVTVYAPYDADGMKVFNKAAVVVLNNSHTEKGHKGIGMTVADQFAHPSTPFSTAEDLLNLNRYRLFGLLEANHIKQPSLMEIWQDADDRLDKALKARKWLDQHGLDAPLGEDVPEEYRTIERTHWADKIAGDAASSAAISRCAYPPIVDTLNDLITAVVLLLLLAMPFAYALERLLVGTPHIYRQIGWFTVFFVMTFAVLYFVNPAFRIASTPIVIFLAFAIILLSCLVIFIMVRKLQTEIKRMQGLASTVHSADVSRLSTMLAAVNMGISTMRRRPLRTFLTAATVVLLTFTILTFASFGKRYGVRETYEGPLNGPPRILVRNQLLGPIARGTFDMLRGRFRGQADVVPRYWVSPTAAEARKAMQGGTTHEFQANVAGTDQRVLLNAAVGLDARDVMRQPALARLLDPLALTEAERDENRQRQAEDKPEMTRQEVLARRLEAGGAFFTTAICGELKLTDDDIGTPVRLGDQRVIFAGRVADALSGHTMLDGTSSLPVNYQSSAGGSAEALEEEPTTSLFETTQAESAQFLPYGVDTVAVIPAETARQMDNKIVTMTLYPHEADALREIAEETAKLVKIPTYAGRQGAVHRLLFTSLTEASGVRDLFIPVVLGGMIVFATMLGSVSDREKEIYTFSSLGLAPPHVAGLFFAEASIYAVVGGMGGYLLGQLVARVLGFLGELGYVAVPTMNYSSTNAIVTILIVMGTVMISTIYPALKASRSANPGIQRQWRIPKPSGNLYDLVFPFTVSAYDITGVVSFLKEHFDNYRDASLGKFATTRCRIFRQQDNDMLAFDATVALAPFDLGVNQRFVLLSRPSEIEGIDEVRILIYRISGANGDWQRSNRVFINDLRKQLLIWRSLPEDVTESYRRKTLESWDELPVEHIDADNIAPTSPDTLTRQNDEQESDA